ncbi:MAG: hypothetical protein ACOCWU_05555 [Spirochaetota bacterium]
MTSEKMHDVIAYGEDGDGIMRSTRAFQPAVNAAAEQGGGTVDGRGAAFMDYDEPTYDATFSEAAYVAMTPDRRHKCVSEYRRKRPTWLFFLRCCWNVRFLDFRIVDAAIDHAVFLM